MTDNRKTSFHQVGEFHDTFNHPRFTTPQCNIFVDNPKEVALRIKLIREELDELEEACKNHDMVEVVDALCDIKYVTIERTSPTANSTTFYNDASRTSVFYTTDGVTTADVKDLRYIKLLNTDDVSWGTPPNMEGYIDDIESVHVIQIIKYQINKI